MSGTATQSAIAPEQRKSTFRYLFFSQVLMVALWPYLDRPGWPLLFYRLVGISVLVAAVFALSRARANWIVSLALGVPTVLLNSAYAFRPGPTLTLATAVCGIAFLVCTVAALLRAVLSSRRVTSDTILGAISVYMLMALTWEVAYLLLTSLQPGALWLDPVRHPGQTVDWGDCIFYSYVTLTSLGYGDIVPMTRQARSLSILEAISGIMYVAVLVARLVGLYSASKTEG